MRWLKSRAPMPGPVMVLDLENLNDAIKRRVETSDWSAPTAGSSRLLAGRPGAGLPPLTDQLLYDAVGFWTVLCGSLDEPRRSALVRAVAMAWAHRDERAIRRTLCAAVAMQELRRHQVSAPIGVEAIRQAANQWDLAAGAPFSAPVADPTLLPPASDLGPLLVRSTQFQEDLQRFLTDPVHPMAW